MIEPGSLAQIAQEVRSCVDHDQVILDDMRAEVRPLRPETRRIHPRSATAISVVGTDDGNNQLRFDPFMVHLIRVVDSSENELCLEAITQNTPLEVLNARHFATDGQPKTALGEMMAFLEVKRLQDLSPVLRGRSAVSGEPRELAASWVAVCREMTEWAVLFSLLRRKDFGTDTVIVRDGFLRSKMFAESSLANCATGWTRQFVAGKMYLVKFGHSPYDPFWAIDLLISQTESAPTTLGYLLEDAKDGFPVRLYPQCLQRAHESAALVDFDMEILEDQIRNALRESLAEKRTIVDELAFQDRDPASRRYRLT